MLLWSWFNIILLGITSLIMILLNVSVIIDDAKRKLIGVGDIIVYLLIGIFALSGISSVVELALMLR